MANDKSPSPEKSPSSDSPPPSGSSPPSSPHPSPSSPSDDNSSSPPSDDGGSSSSSPPPPSEKSPSPPPPSEKTPSPPPPSEGSPPAPPTQGGSNSSSSGGGNNQPPPSGNNNVPSVPGVPPQEVVPPKPISPSNQTPAATLPNNNGGSSSNNGKSASHVRVEAIAGVVAVGGVLLLFMCICIMCVKKKKKKGAGAPPYGWDTANTKPQGNNNQYWQEGGPQEHAVKIPPPSAAEWGHQIGGGGHSSESGPQLGLNTTSSAAMAASPSLTLGFNKSTFTYEELATATNGFDRTWMLGQGGFGYVYKGVLSSSGKEVAVKSLKSGSGQGEREFQSEVEIISRVHHRHLVSLVGYCIARGQRMLVYDFVPNGTLEYHLHKKGELDFPTRLRIALGSAKGLGYLHEDCHPRIIHRDIKASNILLDDNYEAMVADFGLAKLTTDTNSHISTRVMGTFGYLAPEYASSGKLTEKSDVFSYGVMLLEIITGRRPVDPNMKYMEDSLVDWSRPLLAKALEGGSYHEFVDPRLEGDYDPNLMKRMVACAAASIRHSAKRRPKMSQIVRALEGDVSLDDLNNEGAKPGRGSMPSSSEGSEYDTRAYSADLKKFRQMAYATQDFASSEYGGTTSEYGLNPSSTSSESSRETNSKNMAKN